MTMDERTMICVDDVCRSMGECAWGETNACFEPNPVEEACGRCGWPWPDCSCGYEDENDLMGIDINGFKTLGYS